MIIRLVHVKVRPGKQAEFRQVLELLSVPEVQRRHGLIAFYPGQPLGPASEDFVLVTVWKGRKGQEIGCSQEWIEKIIPHEAMPLVEEWHETGYTGFGVLEKPLRPLYQNI